VEKEKNMEHEIVTKDFYGKSVEFMRRGGEADSSLWMTAEQAAVPLGLSSGKHVRKLFNNHKSEFNEGLEFAFVRLDVPTVRPSEGRTGMQKKECLIFSLAGIDLLALLVRNEIGKKARRWTTDLRSSIRSGEKSIIDTGKLVAYTANLEARIKASEERELRLVDLSAKQASAIASALAFRRYQKEDETKLLEEHGGGQARFRFEGAGP
jgi:prophage antirepressor-like protein